MREPLAENRAIQGRNSDQSKANGQEKVPHNAERPVAWGRPAFLVVLANTKPVGVWEGGFDIRLGDRWRAGNSGWGKAHSVVQPVGLNAFP